jgi:hypothetical protein
MNRVWDIETSIFEIILRTYYDVSQKTNTKINSIGLFRLSPVKLFTDLGS